MANRFWNRLPGIIAVTVVTLVTTFWAFWGTGEMYHEGWWGAWYNPLLYLIPGTLFLMLTFTTGLPTSIASDEHSERYAHFLVQRIRELDAQERRESASQLPLCARALI